MSGGKLLTTLKVPDPESQRLYGSQAHIEIE